MAQHFKDGPWAPKSRYRCHHANQRAICFGQVLKYKETAVMIMSMCNLSSSLGSLNSFRLVSFHHSAIPKITKPSLFSQFPKVVSSMSYHKELAAAKKAASLAARLCQAILLFSLSLSLSLSLLLFLFFVISLCDDLKD